MTEHTFMIELSEIEREARTLLERDRASAKDSTPGTMIRSVFRAKHASSFTITEIAAIASVLAGNFNQPYPNSTFLPELDRMVKAKVLRRRMKGTDLLYELNFAA